MKFIHNTSTVILRLMSLYQKRVADWQKASLARISHFASLSVDAPREVYGIAQQRMLIFRDFNVQEWSHGMLCDKKLFTRSPNERNVKKSLRTGMILLGGRSRNNEWYLHLNIFYLQLQKTTIVLEFNRKKLNSALLDREGDTAVVCKQAHTGGYFSSLFSLTHLCHCRPTSVFRLLPIWHVVTVFVSSLNI